MKPLPTATCRFSPVSWTITGRPAAIGVRGQRIGRMDVDLLVIADSVFIQIGLIAFITLLATISVLLGLDGGIKNVLAVDEATEPCPAVPSRLRPPRDEIPRLGSLVSRRRRDEERVHLRVRPAERGEHVEEVGGDELEGM